MNLILYTEIDKEIEPIKNFLNFYYSLRMKHLASDLLDKGLSPSQIMAAVTLAIKSAKSSGIETSKHFMPVFSGIKHTIVNDCKLSELAYGLVFLNADVNLPAVGNFQVETVENFIGGGTL